MMRSREGRRRLVPSKLRPRVSPAEGIDTDSAAICRGALALARDRLLRRLGAASAGTLGEVEDALATILVLDRPAMPA